MDLKQIIAAETIAGRALRAVRPFMERGPDRDAANRAEFILAEARHFASMWDEIRTREDANEITADEAKTQRQQIIQRLAGVCAPGRL